MSANSDWLTRRTYDTSGLHGPSASLACPACRGREFLVTHAGRIICANEDCYELAGWWYGRTRPDALAGQT